MARQDTFEDRGQSQRPPNQSGARNQGGRFNAPRTPRVGPVAPPPVSRARKDSVLRPVGDGGSSQGGVRAGEVPDGRVPPPAAPPNSAKGPEGVISGEQIGIGPDRQQESTTERKFSENPPVGPPAIRTKDGTPTPEELADQAGAMAHGAGGTPVDVTPGGILPGDAPEALSTAELPPSSPANAGAVKEEQSPEELGGAITESGQALQTPDAQPPQDDPAQAAGMPSPAASMESFNEGVKGAKEDAFGGRMGEDLLGMKIENSDQIANGREWKGEIGPGRPANQSGALGIPEQQNSPEDVAFNRQRFDTALAQNKGDKHAAAMSSGAFPSGNPIAHGTMSHLGKLVDTPGGDGVDTNGMDEGTRRRYKADAVRQMEEYGAYPGMDDPESPAPPVRPLSWSFNPHTSKMVSPEGAESYVDRFGGGGENQ